MINKLSVMCITFLTCSVYGMELADVITDSVIVSAVHANNPTLLTNALDARMAHIKFEHEEKLKQELHRHSEARLHVVRTHSGAIKRVMKDLTQNHELRNIAILTQYTLAREKFKNKEVPAYLKLAQELAKHPKATRSELIAKGGVMLGVSIASLVPTLASDFSLSKLVLVPVCLAGCYYGGKTIIDGLEYSEYVARQDVLSKKVRKILQERQGNWFEKAAYALAKNII